MKKLEKSVMSFPIFWISTESYLAPLMNAEQTLEKNLFHSGSFHSPERVQKQRHKTGISNSQNMPLIANKIDPKHVFGGYNAKMLQLAQTYLS